VYYYNGAQRDEQFLQVSRLYWLWYCLVLFCLPNTFVSSVCMVLYVYLKKIASILMLIIIIWNYNQSSASCTHIVHPPNNYIRMTQEVFTMQNNRFWRWRRTSSPISVVPDKLGETCISIFLKKSGWRLMVTLGRNH